MAIGDYARTTYVNDTSPAISATNLNNIEAKVEELDASASVNAIAGEIRLYAGNSTPTGFFACDGSAVSRTTYADLYSAIGTIWGIGDGSTTFNLPDLREAAPVGIGTRAAGVTAHDTYTLAQFKDDQGQSHRHLSANGVPSGGEQTNVPFTLASTTPEATFAYTIRTGSPIEDGNGTPRVGTTTRGKRVGVNYIIKY
jgi:microcystin-dependent protein